MKLCKKCNKNKKLKFFHKNRSQSDGFHKWCKNCRKEEIKRYLDRYFPNREIGKSGRKKVSKEHILKRIKKWTEKNKEKLKLAKRNHYLLNKELYKQKAKIWKAKNKEREKEIRKKYLSTLKGKITKQINREKRRALQKTKDDGTVTKKSIMELYFLQNGLCAISGQELNYKFHIDHIKPLSKGGLHSINNIQLVLAVENLKKSNKWD